MSRSRRAPHTAHCAVAGHPATTPGTTAADRPINLEKSAPPLLPSAVEMTAICDPPPAPSMRGSAAVAGARAISGCGAGSSRGLFVAASVRDGGGDAASRGRRAGDGPGVAVASPWVSPAGPPAGGDGPARTDAGGSSRDSFGVAAPRICRRRVRRRRRR
jgi:hypothetical protein